MRPLLARLQNRTFSTTSASRAAQRRRSPRQQQVENAQHPLSSSAPVADNMMPPAPVVYVVGGYLALVNAAAVGLFWYDKFQATSKGWRVPERQLQLTALLGGWVGGMWAMEQFRHKTAKKAFREPYFLAVAANGLLMAGAAGLWVASPAARASVARMSRSITGM
ncbi:hypothetical protein HDU67_001670 [Dinochytrium kinnereticum]|nr:hypothetical protein HDU67_001670 [Dinochytrium kinnereticum]